MQRFVMCLSILFCSLIPFQFSSFADDEASFEQRAKHLLLEANPQIELTSDEAKEQVEVIKNELDAVFQSTFTETAKQVYANTPHSFSFGELLLTISDKKTRKKLIEKLNGDETIDLRENTLDIEALDTLNKQYHATEYRLLMEIEDSTSFFEVLYATDFNPNLVVQAYNQLDIVESAELNHVLGGDGAEIERFLTQPTLYKVTLGWGDCLAGCMYGHRFYFETPRDQDENVSSTMIGSSGDEIPADLRDRYIRAEKEERLDEEEDF